MNVASFNIYQSALFKIPGSQLLRPYAFDFWLIPGITLISILAGFLSIKDPDLFPYLLFLDIWILGYHHVVSTYTRLFFDFTSFKEHKFLIFYLPFLVTIPCIGLFYAFGPWVLATMYLYWQWFHYSRQSYGISRIYARKGIQESEKQERLNTLSLYSLPLVGILYRSWQAPDKFLGLELMVLPVADWVLISISFFAGIIMLCWLVSQISLYKAGKLTLSRFYYICSHHVIFAFAYLLIQDINIGWLVINIWHNAQYILIVWLFNVNRFREGVNSEARLLSYISQPERWKIYLLLCVLLSSIMYWSLNFLVKDYSDALPFVVIIYSIINFHHYIVDGIIWKVRKKSVRQNLVAS